MDGNGERNRVRECVFHQSQPCQAIWAPFQRPNGRWTVMDSACGLLINLGEAIGEPLSTCSKLNKAYPEMALFSLNCASAPLSSLDLLQGIRANKMRKCRHCEMMMDIYHTYSKKDYSVRVGLIIQSQEKAKAFHSIRG